MRSALIIFHRWLALTLALVLVVVALTGAATVFEGAVGEASAPRVPAGAAPLPLDAMAERALASIGGGRVSAVGFGRAPDQAYVFSVALDTVEKDLVVNPYTGEVIGPDPPPTTLVRITGRLHQLHTSLLAGSTGRLIVGLVTIGALLLVITGLILWWRERLWRIRWSASWKRIVFDLHHTLGAVAAVVLLVITGTGIWIGFPNQVNPLVLRLNKAPLPAGQPKAPAPDSGAVELPLDSLVRLAHSAVPDAPVLVMLIPANAPAMIFLRYPEDHTPGGRSRVWLDHYRGTVLRAMNTRTAETGTKLMNLERSLHTGDVYGGASRVIWFLASLILASQAVTGTLMWWNSRAARRAASEAPRPDRAL